MWLELKLKSKISALQCRILRWKTTLDILSGGTIRIRWVNIQKIKIKSENLDNKYQLFFKTFGQNSQVEFGQDEVLNFNEFQNFINQYPDLVVYENPSFIGSHSTAKSRALVKPYFKYAGITTKYLIGLAALIFAYYQIKYLGNLFIKKYQFLINASCNVQCAEQIWTMTSLGLLTLAIIFSPLVPVLFYKRVYKLALRSRNVKIVNTALTEMILLAGLGLVLVISSANSLFKTTNKVSRTIASYSSSTSDLSQTKLRHKVELSSSLKSQEPIEPIE